MLWSHILCKMTKFNRTMDTTLNRVKFGSCTISRKSVSYICTTWLDMHIWIGDKLWNAWIGDQLWNAWTKTHPLDDENHNIDGMKWQEIWSNWHLVWPWSNGYKHNISGLCYLTGWPRTAWKDSFPVFQNIEASGKTFQLPRLLGISINTWCLILISTPFFK